MYVLYRENPTNGEISEALYSHTFALIFSNHTHKQTHIYIYKWTTYIYNLKTKPEKYRKYILRSYFVVSL